MSEQFFVIGAQRSGTSYLFRLLDEHPDIQMARPSWPEPKFFLREDTSNFTQREYHQLFFSGSKARLHGEKSTSYIESAEAARRIARVFPQARILVILREPAARAISNYHFSVDHGAEPLDLLDALDRTPDEVQHFDHDQFSVSPWGYIARGHYVRYLESWRSFPMHIELYENLVADSATIARIYEFLGAEAFEPASLGEVVNASNYRAELSEQHWIQLRQQFIESNAALEREYGLDLTPWNDRSRS